MNYTWQEFLQPILEALQWPSPQHIQAVYSSTLFFQSIQTFCCYLSWINFSSNSLPFALSSMNTVERRKYLFLFLTAYHVFEAHQAPFIVNHLKHFHLSFRCHSWTLSQLILVSPLTSLSNWSIAFLKCPRMDIPWGCTNTKQSRAKGLFCIFQAVLVFTL